MFRFIKETLYDAMHYFSFLKATRRMMILQTSHLSLRFFFILSVFLLSSLNTTHSFANSLEINKKNIDFGRMVADSGQTVTISINASDGNVNTNLDSNLFIREPSRGEITLSGLKANTRYEIQIDAIKDEDRGLEIEAEYPLIITTSDNETEFHFYVGGTIKTTQVPEGINLIESLNVLARECNENDPC